ncbi:MAG: peptide ABC transporter substrate-binding protein, partial [Betaproteobacteria bacterium]|nr:peptide ABC transporter substrate-binding protein [Betaproteobacteria bacterium]
YSYHYLKRPFTLTPKLAEEVAKPHYLDKDGKPLPDDAPADQIAESVYDVHIKKGVMYAPHPCFAQDGQGHYLYHHLSRADVGDKRTPFDFAKSGTRELTADDFVYAVKRHATTRIIAPIFAVLSENIIGLKDYGELIKREDAKLLAGLPKDSLDKPFLDFRKWPLAGASAPDRYTFRLRVKGKYPQMKYWMAMTFFAPVPWEADAFYSQPGMAENGLSLNVWPVGTGPYMATVYEQDRRHVLERNPNFRGEPYPCHGMPGDKEKGLLDDCGKTMPFVDKIVFDNEKEKVPFKAKFIAGYYDIPEMERDDWGQQFLDDMNNSADVAKLYKERGFQFPRDVGATIWYVGYNMLDPVLGAGKTPEEAERHRKLRQAINIAIDWKEYSLLFPQKGGVVAHSPIPPGIFGSRYGTKEGMDPYTENWVEDGKGGHAERKPISEARQLLAEAGYPDGRDATTGRPLVINYDFQRVLTPEFKAEMDWMIKQFAKLNIQLEIRATDFNQYQDKKRKGALQFALGGWFADYPDPENFLFLLYGPNSAAKFDGDNLFNYDNPEYNKLFEQMKQLDDGPERQQVIDRMVHILQRDGVWSFGYYPWSTGAFQPWVHNGVVPVMFRDMSKYYRLDVPMRVQKLAEWNHPVYWPLGVFALLVVVLAWVAWRSFRRRERTSARGQVVPLQGS